MKLSAVSTILLLAACLAWPQSSMDKETTGQTAKIRALALARVNALAERLDRPVVIETGLGLANVDDKVWEEALAMEPGQLVNFVTGVTESEHMDIDGAQVFLAPRTTETSRSAAVGQRLAAWLNGLRPAQKRALLSPEGLSTRELRDEELWQALSVRYFDGLGVAVAQAPEESNLGVMAVPYVEFEKDGAVRRMPFPGRSLRTLPGNSSSAAPADWRRMVPSKELGPKVDGPLSYGKAQWLEFYQFVSRASKAFDMKLSYDLRIERYELIASGKFDKDRWLSVFKELAATTEPSVVEGQEGEQSAANLLAELYAGEWDKVPLATDELKGVSPADFANRRSMPLSALLEQNPRLQKWVTTTLKLDGTETVRLGLRPILRIEAPGRTYLPNQFQMGKLRVAMSNVGWIELGR